MKETDNPYNVPGLERGMQILMLFDRTRPAIGAPEFAQALGIPRTTVFRLLQTLQHLKLIVATESGAYRLGPAVLRLGFEYIASIDLTELARPIVERLRDATGLPAQLVIRDDREVVVVLRFAGTSAFESSVNVGTRMPAHATILGRMLLADLNAAELRRLYPERELKRYSAHTPKNVAALSKLLEADRARGFAVSESFYERGISAVAAPVRDDTGRIVAAISVTTQRESIPASERTVLIKQVVTAAGELSGQLSYRGSRTAA
ncbi:MAG: IclR family transcriptional regulator [Burkholderiales bacterium]